jgi:hypothetical protein
VAYIKRKKEQEAVKKIRLKIFSLLYENNIKEAILLGIFS